MCQPSAPLVSSADKGLQHTIPYTSACHPVVHLVGTGDVDLAALTLAGQTTCHDTEADPANLWRQARQGRAMGEQRDGPSWLCDEDDDIYQVYSAFIVVQQMATTSLYCSLLTILTLIFCRHKGQKQTILSDLATVNPLNNKHARHRGPL